MLRVTLQHVVRVEAGCSVALRLSNPGPNLPRPDLRRLASTSAGSSLLPKADDFAERHIGPRRHEQERMLALLGFKVSNTPPPPTQTCSFSPPSSSSSSYRSPSLYQFFHPFPHPGTHPLLLYTYLLFLHSLLQCISSSSHYPLLRFKLVHALFHSSPLSRFKTIKIRTKKCSLTFVTLCGQCLDYYLTT